MTSTSDVVFFIIGFYASSEEVIYDMLDQDKSILYQSSPFAGNKVGLRLTYLKALFIYYPFSVISCLFMYNLTGKYLLRCPPK